MWNGDQPGFCSCHGYASRYENWDFPETSSMVRGRARSRSPFNNNKPGTEILKGEKRKDGKHGLQEQNLCLKRKFKELQRYHERERKIWSLEKEGFLREITEIKAGENRGNLLELKAILEVIQTEQRKEEKKWTDFLLQFLNNRCGWELERRELHHHISQLEANSAQTCTNKLTSIIHKDLRKEKEAQKSLLEDTHTAAMELRKQIENNDRNWKVEKMELMERFDSERREWECQWKIMQRKIEELYQEVKLRRENKLNEEDKKIQEKAFPFAVPFSHPEPREIPTTGRTTHQHNINNQTDTSDKIYPNVCPNPNKEQTSELKTASSKVESEKCLDQKMSKSDNDILNDALKEIARVSEELCKYQEEIRNKTYCKRTVPSPSVRGTKEAGNKPLNAENNFVSKNKQIIHGNKLNNSKNLEFTLCNSLSEQSKFTSTPVELQETSFSPWGFSWDLTNSLFPETDKTSVSGTGKKCSTASKKDAASNSAEFVVNKNFDGLCHVKVLCDINTLEEDNLAETFLTNSLTPEIDQQNGFIDHSGIQHPGNLHPDMIMLGHSFSSDSNYDNMKNGKLAAKIDEFNRIVFKTGKGNSIFPDLSLDIPQTGIGELHNYSPCDYPNTASLKTCCVTEKSVPAFEESDLHVTNKSVKVTAQQYQHQPTGTHSTSSYQNMFQEHNWKPSNLSGRPRSADSRSNYRVVEKLLKSYEDKTASPFCNSKHSSSKMTQSDLLLTETGSEALTQCLEMLQLDQTAEVLQRDISIFWHPRQEALSLKQPEMSLLVTSSNGKGFSRPARPANRRPPSRWASTRSPPSLPLAIKRTAN
ncbi:uncharacterized protein KIAA0408 homolog [Pelodytes ibericus]